MTALPINVEICISASEVSLNIYCLYALWNVNSHLVYYTIKVRSTIRTCIKHKALSKLSETQCYGWGKSIGERVSQITLRN